MTHDIELGSPQWLWDLAAAGASSGLGLSPAPSVPVVAWKNATVLGVHDGDSISVRVVHNRVGTRELAEAPVAIRLLGCNARELSAPGGQEAQANLAALLPIGTPVVLLVTHDDNYGGRLDAAVTYLAADGQPHDLVTDLAAGQWVAPWNGQGAQPVPPWPRTVS